MHTWQSVWFNGIEYRRYPQSPSESARKYYTAIGPRGTRTRYDRLHREIWKSLHGPIPKGHDIHHIDGNPLNNAPDNLSAVPHGTHLMHHGDLMRGQPAGSWHQAHLARIRPLTVAWKHTEQGRAWLREQARITLHGGPPQDRICEWCAAPYTTRTARRSNLRFCGPRCQSAWRRASGVDDVVRACTHCGQPFTINKNQTTALCSMRCVALAREARRKAMRVPVDRSIAKTCALCGSAFRVFSNAKAQRFCSVRCAGLAKRKAHHQS